MDVRGALGLSDEVRNGFDQIRVSFDVEGDAPPEKLRELVERAKARSAVFDMVTNGVEVHVGTTLTATGRPDDGRHADPHRHPDRRRRPGRARPEPLPGRRRPRARPARARPRRPALARALGLADAALPELDEPAAGRAGATPTRRVPRPLGFIGYLEEYARSFAAPVVEGVEVERVERSRAASGSTRARAPGSPATSSWRPATPTSRTFRFRPRTACPSRSTRPSTAARSSSRTAACWSSVPARAGSSSPSSCAGGP